MKLSDIKSGMIIEVYCKDVEDTVSYLIPEINGQLMAFNSTSTLGEIDFWFNEDLSAKEYVELMSVLDIIDSEINVMSIVEDGLGDTKLLYTKE